MHVLRVELPHAFVQHSADFRVAMVGVGDSFGDVLFAVLQVLHQLRQIFKHNCSVAENLLTALELANIVLLDVSLRVVVQNGHGVVKLLAVEEDVQTCLSKVGHVELERHLREERAVLEVHGMDVQNLKSTR